MQVDIAANPLFRVNIGAGDILTVIENNSGGTALYQLSTNAVFRDPSAWYHLVIVFDSTNATSAERIRMYVNGVRITSFAAAIYPALNQVSLLNSTTTHQIGRLASNDTTNLFDGYLTEINFVNGQALTPSSFGEFNSITGVWQPKKYTGTYGTNGFYLNFSDNSAATAAAIGKDYSGNGNNWTPNNISVTAGVTYDSMLDVPTLWADGGNGRGNYCTLNPLRDKAASLTLNNGNLKLISSADVWNTVVASISIPTSGKWYWECTVDSGSYIMLGLTEETAPLAGQYPGATYGYGYFSLNGLKHVNSTSAAYGAAFTTIGDVVGVAVDVDANTLTFYKNGVSQGVAYSTAVNTKLSPAFAVYGASGTVGISTVQVNFGQRPFTYTPPTGYKALNTQNLPVSSIPAGRSFFNIALYTGNGTNIQVPHGITGGAPDFAWLKSRSAATNNGVFDSVRGWAKALYTNTTGAEVVTAGVGQVTSTVLDIAGDAAFNTLNATYVAWSWRAGGAAVSNTAGSITSQVSANVSAGFSVMTYTGNGVAGATVGHGLGVAPKMVIVKQRNVVSVTGWNVYHASVGNTAGMYLNLTTAATTGAGFWNNTSPTSSVFSLGTGVDGNANGNTYVAYCFTEVAGFSKFGSYTGNGSADGPFVHLGFRPRYVMWKNVSAVSDWRIQDTSRNPSNVSVSRLFPNLSNAEDSSGAIDILSNGFKVRETSTTTNGNGNTIVFAAFAENPFKYTLAR